MSRVALMALIGGCLVAVALRSLDGPTAIPTSLWEDEEWFEDWVDPPEPLL